MGSEERGEVVDEGNAFGVVDVAMSMGGLSLVFT
jgi:hypothetical protein